MKREDVKRDIALPGHYSRFTACPEQGRRVSRFKLNQRLPHEVLLNLICNLHKGHIPRAYGSAPEN